MQTAISTKMIPFDYTDDSIWYINFSAIIELNTVIRIANARTIPMGTNPQRYLAIHQTCPANYFHALILSLTGPSAPPSGAGLSANINYSFVSPYKYGCVVDGFNNSEFGAVDTPVIITYKPWGDWGGDANFHEIDTTCYPGGVGVAPWTSIYNQYNAPTSPRVSGIVYPDNDNSNTRRPINLYNPYQVTNWPGDPNDSATKLTAISTPSTPDIPEYIVLFNTRRDVYTAITDNDFDISMSKECRCAPYCRGWITQSACVEHWITITGIKEVEADISDHMVPKTFNIQLNSATNNKDFGDDQSLAPMNWDWTPLRCYKEAYIVLYGKHGRYPRFQIESNSVDMTNPGWEPSVISYSVTLHLNTPILNVIDVGGNNWSATTHTQPIATVLTKSIDDIKYGILSIKDHTGTLAPMINYPLFPSMFKYNKVSYFFGGLNEKLRWQYTFLNPDEVFNAPMFNDADYPKEASPSQYLSYTGMGVKAERDCIELVAIAGINNNPLQPATTIYKMLPLGSLRISHSAAISNVFPPGSPSLEIIGNLQIGKYAHSYTINGTNLVVSGGYDHIPQGISNEQYLINSAIASNTIEVYNLRTKTSSVYHMLYHRAWHSMINLNSEEILIVGGDSFLDADPYGQGTWEVFNITLGRSTDHGLTERKRLLPCLTLKENKDIIIKGGYGASTGNMWGADYIPKPMSWIPSITRQVHETPQDPPQAPLLSFVNATTWQEPNGEVGSHIATEQPSEIWKDPHPPIPTITGCNPSPTTIDNGYLVLAEDLQGIALEGENFYRITNITIDGHNVTYELLGLGTGYKPIYIDITFLELDHSILGKIEFWCGSVKYSSGYHLDIALTAQLDATKNDTTISAVLSNITGRLQHVAWSISSDGQQTWSEPIINTATSHDFTITDTELGYFVKATISNDLQSVDTYAEVEAPALPSPHITSFISDSLEVNEGDMIAFTAEFENGTADINGVTVFSGEPQNIQALYCPTETFTLTVTNGNETVTQEIVVTVHISTMNALFANPTSMVYDPLTQNFYVADTNNNRVRMISLLGFTSTLQTTDETLVDEHGLLINLPTRIAVEADGNIILVTEDRYVYRVVPSGAISQIADLTDSHHISSVTIASNGDIYLASNSGWSSDGQPTFYVQKINTSNVLSTYASFTPDFTSGLNGLVVDSGNVYSIGAHGVRIIHDDNSFTLIAGGFASYYGDDESGFVNGTGAEAKFYYPYDMKMYDGDLYVQDGGNNAIRKVTLAGVVTTYETYDTGAGIGLILDNNGIVYLINDSVIMKVVGGVASVFAGDPNDNSGYQDSPQ